MFDLIDYLFAFLIAAVPVQHHRYAEPVERTLARYSSIAQDIATVALDPSEAPVYEGPDARAKTAVLLASIAASESFLRADVDSCKAKGDGGKSATIFQLQNAPSSVCTDRQEATRLALARVRQSLDSCRKQPPAERLSLYASGRCDRGQKASRYRWTRAERWTSTHPVIDPDELDMY